MNNAPNAGQRVTFTFYGEERTGEVLRGATERPSHVLVRMDKSANPRSFPRYIVLAVASLTPSEN